jgi:streptogramin lyase
MLIALLAAALLAPPAHAEEVARVPLGSRIDSLVAGPDGGAWVVIAGPRGFSIGRATTEGRFLTALTGGLIEPGTIGPDGAAWFRACCSLTHGFGFVRSDGAGALTRFGPYRRRGAELGSGLATGPDGTLWVTTSSRSTLAHLTADGAISYSSIALPSCPGSLDLAALERAADGAMWLADDHCRRVVRVPPGGPPTVIETTGSEPESLSADTSGGVWFRASLDGRQVGHVDAGGRVTHIPLPFPSLVSDLAAAPDGSAWIALGSCFVGRVTLDGTVAFRRAPVPAEHVAVDPAGRLWLASPARLVRFAPGETAGRCDERPPSVLARATVSLSALRRGGARVRVREPAVIDVTAFYGDLQSGAYRTIVSTARGGTLRVPIRASWIARLKRRLAAGGRPELTLLVTAVDAEGNSGTESLSVRVTR